MYKQSTREGRSFSVVFVGMNLEANMMFRGMRELCMTISLGSVHSVPKYLKGRAYLKSTMFKLIAR